MSALGAEGRRGQRTRSSRPSLAIYRVQNQPPGTRDCFKTKIKKKEQKIPSCKMKRP